MGVNDRNKHLFEGMWPLPYGVSYNSYLIDDDIVALVDTVDACFFETYLRKIRCIIGDRPIQYLIINHMEPDHSGSIRLIKQHYPDIVIVGNKQTFGMIEGYYGVTGDRYEVKDESMLDLGHHKLKFYLTPMVHWPETMMTFDETDGILFAGDAFGCFGTLDGGFLDTRINLDKYWEEMVRYYSNIVGKYGNPVQKALAKLGHLPIEHCSRGRRLRPPEPLRGRGRRGHRLRQHVWQYGADGRSHCRRAVCPRYQEHCDA